jgi:hypothetical protein
MNQACDGLLAETWPVGIPRYVRDPHDVDSITDNVLVVPHTLEDLLKWAYVKQDDNEGDSRRNKFLAYKCPAKQGQEIIFSFQGFIRDPCLTTYGDWDG